MQPLLSRATADEQGPAQSTLFSGEVMRFDAIAPRKSEHRPAPLAASGCVFVYVFVCQQSGLFCLEVLLTVDFAVDILGPLVV